MFDGLLGDSDEQYYPLWYPPDAEHLKKGWDAVRKAEAIAPKAAREHDYIAALDAFWGYAKRDYATRAAAYAYAMRTVYVRYPQDHEAAAFFALALIATASPTDKTYARQREAGRILERLFAEQPNHPGLAHYIIHAYGNPALASHALPAARRYANIAPSVPHALHMPSHIFTRLGLWQESIQSNLAAEAAAKDYATKTHMAGAWAEQLHAMDYLVYAYLQGGQDREAGRVVNELATIEKSQPQDQKSAYAAQGRIEESLKLMRDAASLEDATEKSSVTPGPIVPARELLAGVLLESAQAGIDRIRALANSVARPALRRCAGDRTLGKSGKG